MREVAKGSYSQAVLTREPLEWETVSFFVMAEVIDAFSASAATDTLC